MDYQIKVNKTFLKELSKLPETQRLKIERFIFIEAKSCESLREFPNLKKLRGFKNYYRIRFGEYRAGISVKENNLVFERLLHRKEIYRFFP